MALGSLYQTLLLLATVWLVRLYVQPRRKLLDFPIISAEHGAPDLRKAVKDGYIKYNDRPFQLKSKGKSLVLLPPKYFNEIRSITESQWSSRLESRRVFESRFTGLGNNAHLAMEAVKTDLTRNISRTLDALQDEMVFAAEQNIGACEDWTPIMPYPVLARIVALISSRVFVGLPFSRNEDWVQISINFTLISFGAAAKFSSFPVWMRPFVVPFLDVTRMIHKQRAKAVKLLTPVIQERSKASGLPDDQKPNDMIQWAMDSGKGGVGLSIEEQAELQLTLSMAAIHTTSTTVLYCLYDLCAHPEYVEPLREEIESVLAENNGRLVKRNMTKLRKLDSFIKESQRLSPPGLVAMKRLVLSDITLSDGTLLPKGASVAVPSWGVTRDEHLWADPETFDGFRFAKLRDAPGSEHKHQFATAGPDSLSFGYGPQACPGRFFASNEIKVLLSHILLNYDIKLEGGKRPENIFHETMIMPNKGTKLLFKKRI